MGEWSEIRVVHEAWSARARVHYFLSGFEVGDQFLSRDDMWSSFWSYLLAFLLQIFVTVIDTQETRWNNWLWLGTGNLRVEFEFRLCYLHLLTVWTPLSSEFKTSLVQTTYCSNWLNQSGSESYPIVPPECR